MKRYAEYSQSNIINVGKDRFSIKDIPLHWCDYGLTNYKANISQIHPYDDATYYYAVINGNVAKFYMYNKVKSSMTLPVFDEDNYEDESEYLDTIIEMTCRELRELNKTIKPRILHD